MSVPALLTAAPTTSTRGAGAAVRRGVRVAASCIPVVLGVLRWAGRHWLWTALAAVVGVAAVLAHHPAVVVLAVVVVVLPAAASVAWSTRFPATYERWAAAPWRQWSWRIRHHLTWTRTSQALGLGRTRTRTRRTRDGGRRTEQVWKPTRCRVRTTPIAMRLDVSTPLGMGVDQVLSTAEALAAAAGASSVRARRLSPSRCRFDLTMIDALAVPRVSADPTATGPVVLGRCEDGTELTWDPVTDAHGALQGMTRSGKSALSYTLLGALAARPDVVVCGVDPSGILLDPFEHGRGAAWIACGTADFTRAAAALTGVVAEMDRRIADLKAAGLDKLEHFTASRPVLVVVLEEWPGTQSACQAEDKATGRTGADAVLPVIERAAGRLIKEGAKVGVRVFVIAQRMSATAISTDDRANLSLRITLRVDNGDAIRMLHDGADSIAREVREFAPGCALAESTGTSLQRARMDFTSFALYRRRVATGLATVTELPSPAPVVSPAPSPVLVLDPVPVDLTKPSDPPLRRRQPKQPRRASAA